MRIALMHFHLNAGGVTTVIRQQAALLVGAGHEVLLITGRAPSERMPAPVAVIPGLDYGRMDDGVFAKVMEAFCRLWPLTDPDLLHVHNPTLAKNRHLQQLLKRLQQSGVTLLCQVHDFAEDGRPDVYFDEPYVADCHYAVVNSRDRHLLQQAGLDPKGVHYLPNTVALLAPAAVPAVTAPAPVLYPVRAIRRKNIGEAILLRLAMDMDAPLAVTLAPTSARDLPGYRSWQAFVRRHRLPVVFEAGVGRDFREVLDGCRYAITTSITEGFGFSFLEPWTAGKALWGRLLPDICRDFVECGLRLGHLYTRLAVPLTWVDAERLGRDWRDAYMDAARQFSHSMDAERIAQGWREVSANDCIDFGLLDESAQQATLQRVVTAPAAIGRLIALNPFLSRPGPPENIDELVAHNLAVVRRHFNPEHYLQRLVHVYNRVLERPVRHAIDRQVLVEAFLTPDRFSLLKWGLPHE